VAVRETVCPTERFVVLWGKVILWGDFATVKLVVTWGAEA
jgi:hypothetical protein